MLQTVLQCLYSPFSHTLVFSWVHVLRTKNYHFLSSLAAKYGPVTSIWPVTNIWSVEYKQSAMHY